MASTIIVGKGLQFDRIQDAINAAKTNDFIYVKKGVYFEYNIVINKALNLHGEKGAIIDGKNTGEVILITADYVTMDGFEIRNVPRSNLQDNAAIRIRRSKYFTIKNITIRNPFFGIYLEKSNNGQVLNNTIYGNAVSEFSSGNAIQLWYSHNNQIEGNNCFQVRDGIYLEFSNGNKIIQNVSEKNVRYGLHFMFCNQNYVGNNTFQNNGAGIAIMFSKEVKVWKNKISNNWGSATYGILLKEVNDSEIKYNDFYKNTVAINIEGCNRIAIVNNDFRSNGWAIKSRGANYKLRVTKNNFLGNAFDLSYYGSLNENSIDGNYWSEYNGYDINRDGVGDVFFSPSKTYSEIVQKSPESIVLLRSLFIDILNFTEKVSPSFNKGKIVDHLPKMKLINHDKN